MLTHGHNYSSPAHSSLGPGRYLTPWRVPALGEQKEKLLSTTRRMTASEEQQMQHTGDNIQQND